MYHGFVRSLLCDWAPCTAKFSLPACSTKTELMMKLGQPTVTEALEIWKKNCFLKPLMIKITSPRKCKINFLLGKVNTWIIILRFALEGGSVINKNSSASFEGLLFVFYETDWWLMVEGRQLVRTQTKSFFFFSFFLILKIFLMNAHTQFKATNKQVNQKWTCLKTFRTMEGRTLSWRLKTPTSLWWINWDPCDESSAHTFPQRHTATPQNQSAQSKAV